MASCKKGRKANKEMKLPFFPFFNKKIDEGEKARGFQEEYARVHIQSVR